MLEFEVALKMRNFPELQQRIKKGELISPQEMAEKYNPLAADEQAVVDWLKSQGLTITQTARALGLHPETVSKYSRVEEYRQRPGVKRGSRLDE